MARRSADYYRASTSAAPRRRDARRARMASSLLLLALALGFLIWPFLPLDSEVPTVPPAPAEGAAAVAVSPTPAAEPSPEPSAGAPPALVALPPVGPTATPAADSPVPTAAPAAPAPGVPVRLRIPRFAVDAPVVGVGVLWNGELEAPYRPDQVGWFKLGPRPGEVGNALLDGHRDWIDSAAVFYQLGKMEKGDLVVVVDAKGAEHRFLVDWRELVPADKAPLARLVGPTEAPALTLITCGGQFNRSSKEYTHRWVVRAVAAPPRLPSGHPVFAR